MDNGYIVRFIRKDDKPVEEFFYHTFEDATSHLLLFRDDDSDLYARIEIIDGATEKAYTVTANTQEDCGVYSVAVSSPSGTVKIVELCDVKGIISQTISGDVNQDGVVNTADIVVLQKYLLGIDILTEEQAELADTTADGTVNGLDLGLLRSMIG